MRAAKRESGVPPEAPAKKASSPAAHMPIGAVIRGEVRVVAGLDVVEEGNEDINGKDLSEVPVHDIAEAKAA